MLEQFATGQGGTGDAGAAEIQDGAELLAYRAGLSLARLSWKVSTDNAAEEIKQTPAGDLYKNWADAFAAQEVDEVAAGPYDVTLDAVATERGVVRCKGG